MIVTKNQQLANELTNFCLTCMQSPIKKSLDSRSRILNLLIYLFSNSNGEEPIAENRMAVWFADS